MVAEGERQAALGAGGGVVAEAAGAPACVQRHVRVSREGRRAHLREGGLVVVPKARVVQDELERKKAYILRGMAVACGCGLRKNVGSHVFFT